MIRVKDVFDIIGKDYNHLTVLEYSGCKKYKHYYKCLCKCGTVVNEIYRYSILKGRTKSCGCLKLNSKTSNKLTHGLRYTKIYSIWCGMKARCLNPKNPRYKDYGGRGISICDSWMKFENFYFDMGMPKFSEYSIERIDNNLGYYKDNCKWIKIQEQARNKRNNRILTSDSKSLYLTEWAKIKNLPRQTITTRIDILGWSVDDALNTPKALKKKK